MIDIRKLKELVKLMVENDLSELDLRDEQETVVLRRPYATGGVPMSAPAAMMPLAQHAASPVSSPGGTSVGGASSSADAGLVPITSPMVGTFYASSDPDSPPYVSVGSSVGAETTVCIVEAMKVFSEIKAEVSGTVEKILVNNAEAVEYGQALFLVRPN